MARSFVPPGEKPPARPPGSKLPIWVPTGDPPRPPRKPHVYVIGKWPVKGF